MTSFMFLVKSLLRYGNYWHLNDDDDENLRFLSVFQIIFGLFCQEYVHTYTNQFHLYNEMFNQHKNYDEMCRDVMAAFLSRIQLFY